ncbi:MAG: hypothetical protein NTU41_04130 [Chloroflexi bacterium]|nr:hypothetical protein [Chloroflexota bacterium]
MLFRSTGLGKTELKGMILGIERQRDYLIMQVQVVEPVNWRIRAGLSLMDIAALLRALLKLSIISFILMPTHWFKRAEHPGDF